MIPTAKDIEHMRRLRSIMEKSDQPMPRSSQEQNQTVHNNRAPTVAQTGRPDVDAMANILQRFNTASNNAAGQLVEDSKHSPRVREALNTTQTSDGVKIGLYKVTSKLIESDIGKQKLYNVVDDNGTIIFQDLTVLEAAHGIVRLLTKGFSRDHNKITSILELEETFARNRSDAARFKYRFDRCTKLNEKAAANVFSDRFQVSRANAVSARDQLKSILENIR